ncbi:hypothetical protein H0H93_016976 [Arthromyces matolae]|nr:hypothetical protein H0H93_016976 [Arthromyces matolae]
MNHENPLAAFLHITDDLHDIFAQGFDNDQCSPEEILRAALGSLELLEAFLAMWARYLLAQEQRQVERIPRRRAALAKSEAAQMDVSQCQNAQEETKAGTSEVEEEAQMSLDEVKVAVDNGRKNKRKIEREQLDKEASHLRPSKNKRRKSSRDTR